MQRHTSVPGFYIQVVAKIPLVKDFQFLNRLNLYIIAI